jgi:hypothetical protein
MRGISSSGIPGPLSRTATYSDLDEPALRGELDRVRQEVQYYLTKSTFVGPNPWEMQFGGLFHGDLPLFCQQECPQSSTI